MKYRRFALSSWVIFSAVFVHPCLAGSAVGIPSGPISLYFDVPADGARSMLPSVSPLARDGNPAAGYGIGLRYNAMKSVSGAVELRRYDYAVDANLKGERPRNSVMFTMGLRF